MAKNPAAETITHKFFSDGSAYAKCRQCKQYTFEEGRERCIKFGAFTPTIAFGCFSFKTSKKE